MPIEQDLAADQTAGNDVEAADDQGIAVQPAQPVSDVGDEVVAPQPENTASYVSPVATAPAPGGNSAMRIFTRAQTDLAVQTEGKRPATLDQVELAVHHAMVAEGLKPPSQPQAGALAQQLPNPATPSPAPGSPIAPGAVAAAPVPMPGSGAPATPATAAPSPLAPPVAAPPLVTPTAVGPAGPSVGAQKAQHGKFGDALKELIEAPSPESPHYQRVLSVLTTQDPDRIGYLSSKYESGGAGPEAISSGKNDPGGVSYGAYQLSYNKKTLQGFLASDENLWARDFVGLKPRTPAFDKKWKEIAAQDPGLFRDAQFSYIYRTKYAAAVEAVKNATGVDLDTMPDSIRAAVFSMAVQHGRASIPLTNAVVAANASPGISAPDYNEKLLHQLYAKRSDYVISRAKRTTNPGEKKTLLGLPKSRYSKEELDAFTAFLAGD